MRKFLIVTLVLMLALGLSGVAFAQLVEITQTGAEYNFAFVGQHSMDRNIATIAQGGLSPCEANVALVVQEAPDNEAYITQADATVLNLALVEQIDPVTGQVPHTIQTKIRWAIDEFAYGYDAIGSLIECLLGY